MYVWAFVAIVVFFAALALAAVWWSQSHVKRYQVTETREQFLKLASRAAADPTGRSLVELLEALDTAPADCPIIVEWVRRPAFKDAPAGMLLKITWDGNEWRRVYELTAFRQQLAELLELRPAPEGGKARQLLAAMSD